MKKRLDRIVLLLLATRLVLAPNPANAETAGSYTYRVSDGKAIRPDMEAYKFLMTASGIGLVLARDAS